MENLKGFGLNLNEENYHFLIEIPNSREEKIRVIERFQWNEQADKQLIGPHDLIKVEISFEKWGKIEGTLKIFLNGWLKENKYPINTWKKGQNFVAGKLGKEIMVLIWGIEDADPSLVEVAIKNWSGLSSTERIWLYTITNRVNGSKDNKRGWRKALRYILTENPIFRIKKEINLSEDEKEISVSFKDEIIGFGFDPKQTMHHFLVIKPRSSKQNISIWERYQWQFDLEHQEIIFPNTSKYKDKIPDVEKVQISKKKWELVANIFENEFNERMKEEKIRKKCSFKIGQTAVNRLFGKEMILLLWAILDCEEAEISLAIQNWKKLSKEERWWLFTMANAASGEKDNYFGWRKAIKYAFTETIFEEESSNSNFINRLF